MAITGRKILNNTCIVEVNSDPRISIGENCNPGSVALWDDGGVGRIFQKINTNLLGWQEGIGGSNGGVKERFFETDYANTLENYRTRNVSSGGEWEFNFYTPQDFTSLVGIHLIYSPQGNSPGAGKNIDLFSSYGTIGQSITQFSETNTAITFTIGTADTWQALDVSSVFNNLGPNMVCGVRLDHNAILGKLSYVGVRLRYQ